MDGGSTERCGAEDDVEGRASAMLGEGERGKARARICDKNTKNTEDEETRIGIRRDEETKN